MTSLFSIVVPVLNEQRNIAVLLESIFRQSYRPIEVIVVDGGSKDRSVEVIAERASERNGQEFRITLVGETADGRRSAAHARNLGIRESNGNYVLLIDADFVLSDTNIMNELMLVLQTHNTARFRTEKLKDTWLENNLALDSEEHLFKRKIEALAGTAFRREALIDLRFDESLGYGEDVDFLEKIAKRGVPPPIVISASGARHRPQTLTELKRQKRWYGRTALPWLEKSPSLSKVLTLTQGASVVLLALSLLALLTYPTVGLVMLAAFFTLPLTMFFRSSKRSAGRLLYLAFVRYIYAPFCFCLGFTEGAAERIVRTRIDPSRQE